MTMITRPSKTTPWLHPLLTSLNLTIFTKLTVNIIKWLLVKIVNKTENAKTLVKVISKLATDEKRLALHSICNS